MNNNDSDPTRNQSSTSEQTPHSGVYHDEQPVREFDKTPLRDAPVNHMLPEGVTTEHLPYDMLPGGTKEKNSNRRGFIMAGTALAGVGLGVGIFLGLGKNGSADKMPQQSSVSSSSAPAFPSTEQPTTAPSSVSPELYAGRVNPETLVNMTHEQLVKLMQITPADAPTPEKFSQLVVQKLDIWANAGMTPQELSTGPNTDPAKYEDTMQTKYDAAFGEGLFGYNKNYSNQASAIAHNHRVFLERYQLASREGQSNYNAKIVFEKALVMSSNPDGSFDIQITAQLSDNLGNGLPSSPNLVPLSNEGTLTVTMRDWDHNGVFDLEITDSNVYK